jgi:RND family efflux transporter MFP subunit
MKQSCLINALEQVNVHLFTHFLNAQGHENPTHLSPQERSRGRGLHLITGITLFLLLFSCSGNIEKEDEEKEEKMTEVADKPVEVKVKRLEYEDFSYELVSNGTVAAKQKAELRFQTQDVVRKIYVKNGDRVKEGEKIAELDKFKLESAWLNACESLERTKLDLQDVLIGQGYSLRDSASIPPDVLRIAKIRSNYEQNMNNYIQAKYNLDAATLYAPFSGIVANLTVKEFNPSGNDPFCLLIDDRHPEVVFHILESELPLVNLNDKVIVAPFSTPDYTLEGRVTEINPLIDRNGMVKIKATINNKDNKVHEGMNVKVRVQRLLDKRLVIPKSALVLRTNKKVVFTHRNGLANWVYVETSHENSSHYVVTDGLRPGDEIIYEGNFNLAHETPVLIKN